MHKHNQAGIVSFLVTLVMMLVISLIIIGFTQVTNRTQREALDRRLSTQAQYAAESGINMVASKINAASTTVDDNCSDSTTSGNAYYITNPTLSSTDNVAVTCVLVNPMPSSIKIPASPDKSVITPVNTTGAIQSLTFSWLPSQQQVGNKTGCTLSGTFPPQASTNCTFGILRVDLMQTPSTVNVTTLDTSTRTFYLQPVASGGTGSVSFSTSAKGIVAPTTCSSKSCSITISGLSGSSYYARLSTIYRDTPEVTITGTLASGQPVTEFKGAQAIIDATGKAQDVLKRVQVRYPIGITYGDAPYAIQSEDSVCKQYTVGPSIFADSCN